VSGARPLRVLHGGGELAAERSWLDVLAEALRPEFTAGVYFPEPGEPILFGRACAVDGCFCRGNGRPDRALERFLCRGHMRHWRAADGPELDGWLTVGVAPVLPNGDQPAQPCRAAGCVRSRCTRFWCKAHLALWRRAGSPPEEGWALDAPSVRVGGSGCEVPGCGFQSRPRGRLCDYHHRSLCSARRYREGALDVEGYLEKLARDRWACRPRYDFGALAEPLRSEFRFAIQERLDQQQHGVLYLTVQAAARWADGLGVRSLLDHDDAWWRARRRERWPEGEAGTPELAFVRYARARLLRLSEGTGGLDPFSGDVWWVEQLGLAEFSYQQEKTISFACLEPEWFRELVKRWARFRLSSGSMTPGSLAGAVQAIGKFCQFASVGGRPPGGPQALTRDLLERYRAHITASGYARSYRAQLLSSLKGLLDDARMHGWEPALPATATYYRGEMPPRPQALPRFIDEHVMGQIERPESIARIEDLSTRSGVLILIKTGLRVVDVCRLPFAPIVHDAAGAPVLIYYNHKLKREAAQPVERALEEAIVAQQRQVAARYPAGCRWLFPSPRGNPLGERPLTCQTLRKRLYAWLAESEVRDAHGRPVKVTPHQFRHTLATRMINNEVPAEVIRRLLDHDSSRMTDVYARLSDETLKREHETYTRRVNIHGEVIRLDPAGLISEAAWMKERLARAKQALPNGYCGLPLQQSCPHPNACLTCGHFLTSEQFLPVHREQLAETERLIAQAETEGSERKREMNETVRLNLVRIIEGLESIADQSPEDAGPADRVSDGG
jgi:integrase